MIDLNGFGVCADDNLGTGTGECPILDLGDLEGLGLVKKGTKTAVVGGQIDFSEVAFRTLITEGKLNQLRTSYAFEDTTPENEKSTSSTGLMQSVRAGKPMYNFTFKKGLGFAKALQSLKGSDRWDAYMYFSKGMLLAMNTSSANTASFVKGFNGGMFDVDSYKFKVGAETEFSKATLQLKDADEFNSKWVFLTWEELGFNALEIDGAIQTEVTIDAAVLGVSSTVTVSLRDSFNRSISYAALFDDETKWSVTTNGVANVVTAIALVGEQLELTLTDALVATDVVKVSLNGIVEDIDVKYYKSNVYKTIVA